MAGSSPDLVTPVCELLGIRRPILLAGMAGGPNPLELVAAVTEAGGLGVFGATGMTVDAIRRAVGRARQLTDGPLGVNVQLAAPRDGRADEQQVHAFLGRFRQALELPAARPEPPAMDPPLELVAAALDAGASVVSVGLGDPAPAVELARQAGAPVLAMVSTVEDARHSVRSGADVVIAQGFEAGGHRSNFETPEQGLALVGTFALVPQVVDAVDVPVIATGGVADGRGLAAALALGAQGVSVGTRFLLAEESGAPAAYKERLLSLRDTDTLVTDAVSGRPARWIANEVTRSLAYEGPGPLGWPAQTLAIADIRAQAARRGDPELMPMLAGQSAGLAGRVMPAGEIVEEIATQAAEILARLGRNVSAGQ